jgi:hypothetical protein
MTKNVSLKGHRLRKDRPYRSETSLAQRTQILTLHHGGRLFGRQRATWSGLTHCAHPPE